VKVSVIVPAYNEEKAIERTVRVLLDYLANNFDDFEIVVVSDGSRDRTFELAQKHQSESVRVFEYQPNQGKGHALKYGVGKSRGNFVVFYDTGIDFPPSQIGDFLAVLQKTGADIVIGSKRHPQSRVNYPFKRKIISLLAQICVRLFFNLKITDTQVGLKVFRRRVLEEIMPLVLVKRYAFDIELLALGQWKGFKIIEAPVNLHLRFGTAGTMKGVWQTFLDTLAIFYRLKIMGFYAKNSQERERLIREYRTTPWDRVFSIVSRILRMRPTNAKS